MAWDVEKVQRGLKIDHDRIYADLDRMKSKMRREPQRFQYQGFIGKQNGALFAVLMLMDSDALMSPMRLLSRLDEMEQNVDEYSANFTKEEGISMSAVRAGYIEKLNEIRRIANSVEKT